MQKLESIQEIEKGLKIISDTYYNIFDQVDNYVDFADALGEILSGITKMERCLNEK